MTQQCLLVFTCKDTFGIIAAVTTFLSEQHAFICELSEFGDPSTGKFFLRCLFEFPNDNLNMELLSQKFSPIAKRFQADWKFIAPGYRPKVLILVSKFGHCLNDLLYRYQSKRLDMQVEAVISNHTDLKEMVSLYQVPFLHLPTQPQNKGEQEGKILSFIEEKKD